MTSSRIPAVEHQALTLGRQLGKGGQGTVYEVTGRKINKTAGDGWDVVYKEYSPAVLPALHAEALASRADLIGELDTAEGRWLCEKTAWPAAVVQLQGRTCGFLMRAVPERFRFALQSLNGAPGTRRLANMEYLLNDDAYVASIGLTISSRDRLALLGDLATTLARLHSLGITVGDLSPKNLLFTTDPRPECFLIDADAMRLRSATVLPQAETPDWHVPDGEEKATRASDVYKLALLAIRVIARDQTASDPTDLAAASPALAGLARSSLDLDPTRRPPPDLWAEHLIAASTAASTTPASARARSSSQSASMPGQQARRAPGAAPRGWVAPGGKPSAARVRAGVAASIAVVLLVALLLVARTHADQSDSVSDPTAVATSPSVPDPASADRAPQTNPVLVRDTPSVSPTPDAIAAVRVGSCFYDNGTSARPDLVATGCTDGAFQVVRVYPGTTDLSSCDTVSNNDESVSTEVDDRVLCLSYRSPGGTAYHAHQGDCVYGSTGPWSTQTCQTGNFKVLAVYRGTSDNSKCKSWPHYNEWKHFGVTTKPGLDVLLCLSMNYPDDAGYATPNECLIMSGSGSDTTFTNVDSCASSNVVVTGRTSHYNDSAFCGRNGWTTWKPSTYPSLAYTMCWRSK